jgi:4-amino-4-deoxy-L-arabinose transferase-like glycosyltransferase
MVSRNFLEVDANPMFPRIDIAGEKTGITGMEFPVLNYLIYLLSLAFGYHDWFGRLIVLLISSLGIWTFHNILKKQFNPQIAFNSSIVLLFSIWFTYSRKIMPDTMAMSFMFFGIQQGINYFESPRLKPLLWFGFWICLGILSKLPVVFLLFVFIPYMIDRPLLQRNKMAFGYPI